MSDVNRYIEQQANAIQTPINFTSTTGAASAAAALTTTRANIDLLLNELKLEATDGTHARFYFDEMSPQARIVLYRALRDLKAASIA